MTRLSNRQYPMLRAFAEMSPRSFMSMSQAQTFDQRPFRSMLLQAWIAYHPGHGFKITSQGQAAWEEFLDTDIHRLHPELPLTSAFDPAAYGLPAAKKKPRRTAA